MITYEPQDNISATLEQMFELARQHNEEVTATFNRIQLVVHSYDNVEALERAYYEEYDSRYTRPLEAFIEEQRALRGED